MTEQEAIKYLQQLYPNGGHCWLDEQRIEAITMAIKALKEEPVSIWHDASEEPNDMGSCLIFYGCKEAVGHYLHYEPVLYNKREKMFVTSSFPHPTGYKVEQKSFDGGCVAEVYKDRRDRISISDITQWCYFCDLHKLSNVERTVKDWKEMPVSEDLEKAIDTYLATYFGGEKEKQDWLFLKKMAIHFANWQKQQTVNKACKLLDENIEKYICADGEWNIDWNFINDFKKYMEG